ncbi:hypothetical protein ACQUEF_13515 [Vagococcus fluvialis]|uniref:hypothetical protein n=1 Tax=Vagococcus fluvialis TaxID=2738 RepID=UPI003D0A74A3
MLETVKNWYEEVKELPTDESNWGVETIELEKVELDVNLIPDGVLDRLSEQLSISCYYYSYMDIYDIVYSLPLKDENQYVLGLLDKDKLTTFTEIRIESENTSHD